MFVRAHRQGNFFLYMQTLKELVPYFFALDHPNYARWMSVHIHDLQSLPESVLQEFSNGNWVISKTKKRASSIAFDQAHEQNNRSIKAAGGLKGLTGPENEKALNRWKVIAPDLTRIRLSLRIRYAQILKRMRSSFTIRRDCQPKQDFKLRSNHWLLLLSQRETLT